MIGVLLLFASTIVVSVVLLTVVACLDVAGLLIARAAARQREIAIRLSIGCGRLSGWPGSCWPKAWCLRCSGVGLGAVMSVWLARLLDASVPLPFHPI